MTKQLQIRDNVVEQLSSYKTGGSVPISWSDAIQSVLDLKEQFAAECRRLKEENERLKKEMETTK